VKRELRARFQPPCDDPRAEEDDALTTEIHTALTD
jgi:hypothetical protein